MSVEMALEIWKWRLPWTSSISSRSVGNDFQQPLGNEVFRHFRCPTFPTPYGGPACAAHRRPAQAVGVDAERCDLVSSSVFGRRIAHCRVRQAAITLCRNGRSFEPQTYPRAFARRDRAVAGGAPALP